MWELFWEKLFRNKNIQTWKFCLLLNNPFLDDSFMVASNTEVISIAEKCLKEIPSYRKILTKAFRWNYIESLLLCLNTQELQWIIDKKIIKPQDIDHISSTETINDYQKKLNFVCQALKRDIPQNPHYTLKLKGTSFTNEDGVPRQSLLEEIHKLQQENPNTNIFLKAIPYIYTPVIGLSEPAVRIEWEGKCLGFIDKYVAKQLDEEFHDSDYSVTNIKITGGGKISYGATVELNVLSKEKDKESNVYKTSPQKRIPCLQKEE